MPGLDKEKALFYSLAELNNKHRCRGVYQCSQKKASEYSVGRLVKGLESCRLAARLGYSVALTQILRKFGPDNFSQIDALIKTEFEPRSKENAVGIAILLCMNSIVEAGVAEAFGIEKVLDRLKAVYEAHISLRFSVVYTLSALIKQVSSKTIKKIVLPSIKELPNESTTLLSPDALWLVLDIQNVYNDLFNGSFKETWPKSLNQFLLEVSPILSKCYSRASSIHPTWEAVLGSIIPLSNDKFKEVWHKTVEDTFFGNSSERLQGTGLSLVLAFMRKGTSMDKIEIVLSEKLIRALLITKKNGAKDAAADELLAEIMQSEEVKKSPTKIVQKINSVTFNFDHTTHVPLCNHLITCLSPEDLEKHANSLLEVMTKADQEKDHPGVVNQLESCIKAAGKVSRDDLQQEVLTVLWKSRDENGVLKWKSNLSQIFQSFCLTQLQGGRGHFGIPESNVKLLSGLVKLEEDQQPLAKKARKLIKKLDDAIEEHNKGFQALLLHLPLWMRLFPSLEETFSKCLTDVIECCNHLLAGEEGEPSWKDVVLEVFLSLVSSSNKFIRPLLHVAFHHFVPVFSTHHYDKLIEVILAKDPVSVGDEEEEMMDSDDEIENMDDSGSESSEDAPKDASSDEEEEGEVSSEFRSVVRSALGEAAAESDDDDLDDETMLRLDEGLAAAFRSQLEGKKRWRQEKEEQTAQFKLRCFDLLLILLHSQPHPSIILHLIPGFLKTAQQAIKEGTTAGAAPEFSKSLLLLKQIFNLKNLDVDKIPEELLSSTVEQILDISKGISNPELSLVAGQSLSYLVKVSKSSEDKLEVVRERVKFAIEAFLMSTSGSSLTSSILSQPVQNHSEHFVSFLPMLAEAAFAPDGGNVFRKSIALELTISILTGVKDGKKVGKKDWKKLVNRLCAGFVETIKVDAEKKQVNPRYWANVILLLHDIVLFSGKRDLYLLKEEDAMKLLRVLGYSETWEKPSMVGCGQIIQKARKQIAPLFIADIIEKLTQEDDEEPSEKRLKSDAQ